MSRGFVWFAQNSKDVDYAQLSIALARSIKRYNKHDQVCVISDQSTKIEHETIDHVIKLSDDEAQDHDMKFSNEYKIFNLTPFKHTIKLEADMLMTANTDWWWNYLSQHDLVFSIDCLDYKDNVVKDTEYRKIFAINHLPNVYNGLTYFRRSKFAQQFYNICMWITRNWKQVRDECLIRCVDDYPTTDVVYALAYRLMDPTSQHMIDYPWFKFIHNKKGVHKIHHVADADNYLYPLMVADKMYVGGRSTNRLFHYYDKRTPERLNDRVF